ncbi:MAG TPA: hypothetical protein VF614_00810 [Chthoniobacteraceae bacterium]
MLRRAAHCLRNACLFLAGGALACAGAGMFLPPPHIPQVSAKLRYWEKHGHEFDTVFIGSSRTYRQFQPEVFDAVARDHGVKCRSFNLGIDAMFSPEDGFFCDRFLSLKPVLRRAIVELSPFHSERTTLERGSERSIYWRDWKRTKMVYEQHANRRANRWSKFSQHWVLHLRQVLNTARGAALLQRALGIRPDDEKKVLGPRKDGYLPLKRPGGLTGRELAAYTAELSTRKAGAHLRTSAGPGAQSNLEAMLAGLQKTGAEICFVIAPVVPEQRVYPEKAGMAPLHDFSEIPAWPELFDPKERYDAMHLNAAGAERYTRALAQQIFGGSVKP